MASGGVWLACGAVLLQRYIHRHNAVSVAETSVSQRVVLPRFFYVGIFGGLIAVLLISSQDIARKEYLLATGIPIVLELAPVDPRSLMQGDYMTLGFAINNHLSAIERRNADITIPKNKALRVYMQPSDSSASKLVALEDPATKQVMWLESNGITLTVEQPTELVLADLAVLRLNYKDRQWRPNGVDAWFFPEGQASYFENAKYGEFKSNSVGDVLLYQMLNAQAQPMAAPAETTVSMKLMR